jgi:hypothetical protein
MISNRLACFLAVVVTWWPALLPLEGICYVPQGKTMSDVNYNPEDGPKAYSNPMVHARLSAYTTMAREVHGPEFDPATEDLDGEVVMRVGGGKNHGRYWIADGNRLVLYSYSISD